jgi:EpsI family protein
MPKNIFPLKQTLVVCSLFFLTYISINSIGSVKEIPIKKPLSEFPIKIGTWDRAISNKPQLSSTAIEMIGADDYLCDNYAIKGGPSVNLYISYFKCLGKRGGYHSPKNCLPGSGWNITKVEQLQLKTSQLPVRSVNVNLLTVQKGNQKQMVIYWYNQRGRIVASEYLGKIYLIADSILKRRRDASFIRIMALSEDRNSFETIKKLKDFAEKVIVTLEEYLPAS